MSGGESVVWRDWFALTMCSFARMLVAVFVGSVAVIAVDMWTDPGLSNQAAALVIVAAVPLAILSTIPTRLEIRPEEVLVINALSKRVVTRAEVSHLEWRRPLLLLYQPMLRLVTVDGDRVDLLASLSFSGGQRNRRAKQLAEWLHRGEAGPTPPIQKGHAYVRDASLPIPILLGLITWSIAEGRLADAAAILSGLIVLVVTYPISVWLSKAHFGDTDTSLPP